MLATAMEDIFLKKGIPVVPSLGEFTNTHLWSIVLIRIALPTGNNDVWRM